jgi:hypothetical protein
VHRRKEDCREKSGAAHDVHVLERKRVGSLEEGVCDQLLVFVVRGPLGVARIIQFAAGPHPRGLPALAMLAPLVTSNEH